MKVSLFNADWLFCLGENWDEDKAECVCLPHSVQLTPENSSGCRNYQGKCVYHKSFWAPKEDEGRRIVLEFEGAMGVSVLNVNGQKVKEHFCGYTPLVADVSAFLNYGAMNQVEVLLDNSDNSEVPPGKPQADLDFSYDGGLYRDAKLIVTDRLHISHPLLVNEVAGGGVLVWFTDVSEEQATVHAKVHIKNDHAADKACMLTAEIISAEGSVVGQCAASCEVGGNGAMYVEVAMDVKDPLLWSPETPNLYTLRTALTVADNVVFVQDTTIGIRTFEFTVHDGVIFNGKSRRFNGANYHQTWPYIGNAVPNSLLKRDLKLIKSMGMDNVRSHYPFSSVFVEECNRLGLTLVISNVGWQFCQPGIFLERTLQNMRDIIRWQRNNPCVLLWEPILNESPMSYEVQLNFHNAVHEEYPYAPCYTASDWGPTDVAYRDYDPEMLGGWMENYGLVEQKDSAERPRWVREYADFPDDFDNQNTIWRCRRCWGDGAMAESVNRQLNRFDINPEATMYIDVYNDKRLCGYGVWPAIAHNRGYHINPCWGGHLDLFRVPKSSYYFVRSQMDREEAGDVLYVAHWWAETSPEDVAVYSNAERVQLFWNDQLIAEQDPDDIAVKHPPFTFKNIRGRYKTRARSAITAKALVGGKVVAEQKVIAPGVPHHMELKADFMDIPLVADGSDIVAVRCYMKDLDGTVVPLTGDVHPILFEVEGEGEIVGDATIGANPITAEAGIATVLVRSTKKAGDIKIRARMYWPQMFYRGIQPVELTIQSVPAEG